MIREIFKWIGIGLGSLVGLLVLAFVVLYIIGSVKWSRMHGKYDVPVEKITIPMDEDSIARGEHIATIYICEDCHTDNWSGQSDSVPGLITLTIPNLTPGAGGVGATNTDEDWVRAIRHGVGQDGRGLTLMPSRIWYYLSDDDLADLIAYLKSLPPVDNELPKAELGPIGRVMLTLGQLPPDLIPDVISTLRAFINILQGCIHTNRFPYDCKYIHADLDTPQTQTGVRRIWREAGHIQ